MFLKYKVVFGCKYTLFFLFYIFYRCFFSHFEIIRIECGCGGQLLEAVFYGLWLLLAQTPFGIKQVPFS